MNSPSASPDGSTGPSQTRCSDGHSWKGVSCFKRPFLPLDLPSGHEHHFVNDVAIATRLSTKDLQANGVHGSTAPGQHG